MKSSSMYWFICLLSTTTLAGCALNPEGLHHAQSENKDIEIYGTTAGIRGIILRKISSDSTYCAEPQPDAAVSESLSENITVSQGNAGSESEGLSESAEETSLGGRSVNVLLTREIFYRTCEFLSNVSLSDATKLAVFKASLQSVIDLNNTNLGHGSANQSEDTVTNEAASYKDNSDADSINEDAQVDAGF